MTLLPIVLTLGLILGVSWASWQELTGWARGIYQIALWAALIGSWAISMEMLGFPKPVWTEWANRSLEEAEVIATDIREGEAIYIWLRLPNVEMPRAYIYPFSQEMAKKLRKGMEEGEGIGTLMAYPFNSDKQEDKGPDLFYPAPQAPRPDKEIPQSNPMRFDGEQ